MLLQFFKKFSRQKFPSLISVTQVWKPKEAEKECQVNMSDSFKVNNGVKIPKFSQPFVHLSLTSQLFRYCVLSHNFFWPCLAFFMLLIRWRQWIRKKISFGWNLQDLFLNSIQPRLTASSPSPGIRCEVEGFGRFFLLSFFMFFWFNLSLFYDFGF